MAFIFLILLVMTCEQQPHALVGDRDARARRDRLQTEGDLIGDTRFPAGGQTVVDQVNQRPAQGPDVEPADHRTGIPGQHQMITVAIFQIVHELAQITLGRFGFR